jgi:hypothetical protein
LFIQWVKTNSICHMGDCTSFTKLQCRWMKIVNRDHLLESKLARPQIKHWISLKKELVNSNLISNHLHRLTISFKHWVIQKFLPTSVVISVVEVYSKYRDLQLEFRQYENNLSKNLGSKVVHKETKSNNAMLFIKFQQTELLLQFKEFF